jgi:hypothetical protein
LPEDRADSHGGTEHGELPAQTPRQRLRLDRLSVSQLRGDDRHEVRLLPKELSSDTTRRLHAYTGYAGAVLLRPWFALVRRSRAAW